MTPRKGQDDIAVPGSAQPPTPAAQDGPQPTGATRPARGGVTDADPISPEALKAFAHPLRIAMYRYLNAHGSGTASQIARALGESTGQTSYHLRQLERHGIIEDDPNAAPGGRERWWRPVGFRLDSTHLSQPGPARIAAEITLRAVIQERAETLQTWFDSIDTATPWDEAAEHTSSTSSLSLEEAEALGLELQDVLERHVAAAKERKDAGDGVPRRRVRVYIDVFPLPVDE